MGRVKSTNVTSCPLWLNYCFCLSWRLLTVGGHKLWHNRTSHSTADGGLAAVGGQCEAPHWQDAQGHSLTTAPDEQSAGKGRRAHKCVVTKERLRHETSFCSRPAAKGPLPLGWRQKHTTPVHPPLPFTSPCHRPVSASQLVNHGKVMKLSCCRPAWRHNLTAASPLKMKSLSSCCYRRYRHIKCNCGTQRCFNPNRPIHQVTPGGKENIQDVGLEHPSFKAVAAWYPVLKKKMKGWK